MLAPLLCALALAPAAGPDDGGAAILAGRVLYGGPAPEPALVAVNKDEAVCGDRGLVDRSLVVGEGDANGGEEGGGGLANVVVWLDLRASGRDLPDGFGGDENPPAATLDNVGCRFEPHVVLLRTGQELRVVNSDPVAHQATAFLNKNLPFNESVPAGGAAVSRRLAEPEIVPCPVTCPIHPWMKAHLLVQPHAYMAVTGPDGRFEISGLPPGEWAFRVWHEKTGFLKSDELLGDPPAGWDGSTLTVALAAGETADLPPVTADPAAFE